MAHFEKRLSSETKFEGRVITVTLDRVELENGGPCSARQRPERVVEGKGVDLDGGRLNKKNKYH